jgi:hypothetical protein
MKTQVFGKLKHIGYCMLQLFLTLKYRTLRPHSVFKVFCMNLSWVEALICPIHKQGDVHNCENFGGISLVNVAYKVLAMVLYGRLKLYANQITGQYQCGFREGVSAIEQIQTLRQILEKKSWNFK